MSEEPVFDEPMSGEPAFDESITGWSVPALITGTALVTIAVSGALDDSGIAEHPYWVVPAVCLFAACAAVANRTVRRLATS